MFEIEIEGEPVAWRSHGGYGRNSYDRRGTEKAYYRLQIKKQYHHNLPITIAVKVDYTFVMPIPASFSKKAREKTLAGRVQHIKRPDTSNLVKLVEDCLKEIVIKDDSQVVEFCARKLYGENPRTIIKIDLVGYGA